MNTMRAVGDFRGIDLGASSFSEFVLRMDTNRKTIIYARKSSGESHTNQSNYLYVQEALPEQLVSAGVPRDRMIVLERDTGKSAWLSRDFRHDFAHLFNLVGTGEVGTVVARDMSRLFRTQWMKEPADFCARFARHNTQVLTTFAGVWTLLDLRRDSDREAFMRGAREAAAHRNSFRAQSMASREMSALRGNYTGGPAAFGWGVTAGIARYEAADGIAKPPRLFVYPPHAEAKLRIMELSLLPQISTLRQLHQHLRTIGFEVPPFDPETARESFVRSCISRIWVGKRDGRLIAVRPDQAFVPSFRMLENILLEPLALGFRRYGSGENGVYELRRHQRVADAMDMPPDSMIRAERSWVGEFPELAICRTDEEKDLYWRVAAKWSPIDMREAIRSRFTNSVPNPARITVPLALRSKVVHLNPWASKVWCLRHGSEPDGTPAYTHPMLLMSSGTSWDCMKEYMKSNRPDLCAAWANHNMLGQILDLHLKRGIRTALASNTSIIRQDSNDATKLERMEAVAAEIKDLTRERDRQLDGVSALRRSLDGLDQTFVDAELDRFHKERVRPVLSALAERTRESQQIEAAQVAVSPAISEEEVRSALERILASWDTLSLDDKRFAVGLLVERIGVIVGDGYAAKEAIVAFTWVDGITDYLIGWRGPCKDEREWTPEEDAAIQDLWPSGCEWSEIKARILPKRTFRRVRARARELGVAKGAKRSNAWVEEHQNADKSWGERNPHVLYLQLHPEQSAWCYAVHPDGSGDVRRLPDKVADGILSYEEFFSPISTPLHP